MARCLVLEPALPHLAALGHRSVVMDLPVEDGNATFEDYAGVVLASYPTDLEDRCARRLSRSDASCRWLRPSRPASLLVFCAACFLIVVDGRPWNGAPPMARPDAYRTETLDDGSSAFTTFESLRGLPSTPTATPEGCQVGVSAGCGRKTRRSLWDRPYPLRHLPTESSRSNQHPDDAQYVTIEFSRAVTRPRLGIDLVEIPGDHSPFLGRPRQLADLLDRLARKPS